MTFKITDHIEFDSTNRAVCPSCELDGKGKKKNLALVPDTDGAYKCHRGCTSEEIREALGQVKSRPVPTALQPKTPPAKAQVNPQKVRTDHKKLMESDGPAKKWLCDRGIDEEIITHHKLGIVRVKVGNANHWAISIPMLAAGGTTYHIKKRVEPWNKETQELPGYQPWKQYGIPQMVWFTHKPEDATETYLCEGEWDAMMLAKEARELQWKDIAVACFTCGCSNVPPTAELEKLPGKVTIFYDRNDTPLKSGTVPGDAGAQTAAIAIGDRARIAQVPMEDDCIQKGWDVSDALNKGFGTTHFIAAAIAAVKPDPKIASTNSLINSLVWNDDLIKNAPDYTEFLVPDLLTEDELFMVAAPPRLGKSLLAMSLAKAVAEGGQFMGRPCTQGTVVYVKCEDSDAKVKERQKAQEWGEGLPVAWLNEFKLSKMAELEELVEQVDPSLLVLDTLSRIKDSDVSESSAEMSQLLEPLQTIARKYNCCVLLVHHTGKINVDNAKNIDIFDTIRGSSAIRAVCRGSMVLAPGERDYRLVVENGWGKHDLKVVLDANTLTWKLIGEWNPPTNMSQQDQITDALKKLGSASIEQIHEETGIPKGSLYTQLSRLVNSKEAASQVVKEGTKRNYTYRLALFNTIEQLNSVLKRPNEDTDSDRGPIEQKIVCSGKKLSPEISTTSAVPIEVRAFGENPPPPTNTQTVKYNHSTPYAEKDTPFEQAIEHYLTRGEISTTAQYGNMSSNVPVEIEVSENAKTVSPANIFKPGDRVRYTGRNTFKARQCGKRHLTIDSFYKEMAVVSHSDWLTTLSVAICDLAIVK